MAKRHVASHIPVMTIPLSVLDLAPIAEGSDAGSALNNARDLDVLRAALGEKFPTASVAELQFDAAHWADVDEGGGHLVRFVRPRDLDPALGPDSFV